MAGIQLGVLALLGLVGTLERRIVHLDGVPDGGLVQGDDLQHPARPELEPSAGGLEVALQGAISGIGHGLGARSHGRGFEGDLLILDAVLPVDPGIIHRDPRGGLFHQFLDQQLVADFLFPLDEGDAVLPKDRDDLAGGFQLAILSLEDLELTQSGLQAELDLLVRDDDASPFGQLLEELEIHGAAQGLGLEEGDHGLDVRLITHATDHIGEGLFNVLSEDIAAIDAGHHVVRRIGATPTGGEIGHHPQEHHQHDHCHGGLVPLESVPEEAQGRLLVSDRRFTHLGLGGFFIASGDRAHSGS